MLARVEIRAIFLALDKKTDETSRNTTKNGGVCSAAVRYEVICKCSRPLVEKFYTENRLLPLTGNFR